MVGDVVLGLAVILVFGVGVLFLDRGDLGVALAFLVIGAAATFAQRRSQTPVA